MARFIVSKIPFSPAVIVKWSNLTEKDKTHNWNESEKIRNKYDYWNNRILIEEFEHYIVGHRWRSDRDNLVITNSRILTPTLFNLIIARGFSHIHMDNQEKGYWERMTRLWEIANILIAI